MSEEESEPRWESLEEVFQFVDETATELMDVSSQISKICLKNAHDWMTLASHFAAQQQRAIGMAEAAAFIGKKSAINTYDIIAASFDTSNLDELDEEDGDDDGE